MRIVVALTIAGLLLLVSATVGLAASGVSPETTVIPAHGSVWFGEGLALFEMENELPIHGSVWYGAGLARFGVEIPGVNTYDTAMIARGSALDLANSQPLATAASDVNAYDRAMIARGSAPDWANVQQLAAVHDEVNTYDVAMILRGCCSQHIDRESVELALAAVP